MCKFLHNPLTFSVGQEIFLSEYHREKLIKILKLLISIQEVAGSNIFRTNILIYFYRSFSLSVQGN